MDLGLDLAVLLVPQAIIIVSRNLNIKLNFFYNKKAFTLLEILVVIGILSILIGLLTASFGDAGKKTRDSRRKSDLKEIQKAMIMYYQDQAPPSYPDKDDFNTLLGTRNQCWSSGAGCTGNFYMKKLPLDPDTTSSSVVPYKYDVSGMTYTLCACLENPADPDGVATCTVCGSCTSGKCYLVTDL